MRVQIDYTAFAKVMNAAFGTNLPQDFDPFADDASFLVAAYVFEDVGASAYIVSSLSSTEARSLSPSLDLTKHVC